MKHIQQILAELFFILTMLMSFLLTCKMIKQFQNLGKFESKPQDATWGERFFHMLDPDGYKMSFATPLGDE